MPCLCADMRARRPKRTATDDGEQEQEGLECVSSPRTAEEHSALVQEINAEFDAADREVLTEEGEGEGAGAMTARAAAAAAVRQVRTGDVSSALCDMIFCSGAAAHTFTYCKPVDFDQK